MIRLASALLLALLPLAGRTLCNSDDVPAVNTLIERFTHTNYLACWRGSSCG